MALGSAPSGKQFLNPLGTATTTFIINVRKKFSLKGNSHIELAGLQWNQVLFNVVGTRGKVSLGGNSIFDGILMASNRTIELKGDATVSGEIIANRLKLHGASRGPSSINR